MRWDKDNAESVMALAGLYSSHLWDKYWNLGSVAALVARNNPRTLKAVLGLKSIDLPLLARYND